MEKVGLFAAILDMMWARREVVKRLMFPLGLKQILPVSLDFYGV
jgi:hypothetical protein